MLAMIFERCWVRVLFKDTYNNLQKCSKKSNDKLSKSKINRKTMMGSL